MNPNDPLTIMMGDCGGCDGPMLSILLQDRHVLFYINREGVIRYFKHDCHVNPFPDAIKWIESWYSEGSHPEVVFDYITHECLAPITRILSIGEYMDKIRRHS